MREIKYIAIHCADTKPSMTVDIKRIEKWHLKRGWSGVGYHYYIRQDGTLELGRDLDNDGNIIEEIGAHVGGYNSKSIGICWEGGKSEDGKPEDNRTNQQKATLKTLLVLLGSIFNKAKILGHRDFPKVKKSCPNFDVKEWCDENGIEDNR